MKYEYIIILLLLVICGMWSFQTCNHRKEQITNEGKYDSLNLAIDSLTVKVEAVNNRADSLVNHVDSVLGKKRVIAKKKKDAKIDTARHASTVALDSMSRSILIRHGLLFAD